MIPRVKICGLSRPEDIEAVNEAQGIGTSNVDESVEDIQEDDEEEFDTDWSEEE